MKINKSLVLVLLLISLLALAVASQISQLTDVSLEESKSCNEVFYQDFQDVYGYVTRDRNAQTSCLYYHNYTHCTNVSGANTDCSQRQDIYNKSCFAGMELYQSYEKIGREIVLKNKTECSANKFTITIAKGSEKKEIDFSTWGVCVNSTEYGCLAITCGTLKGGSARNSIFNGCDGGKSCQKFLFCQDGVQVLYKASRSDFVRYDPTFQLNQLTIKEVGQ